MQPILENPILDSDFDAACYSLLNVAAIFPVPANITTTTDPRLSDPRAPLDGSVTNASVADDAGIVQTKLNLNGDIPSNWLGTTTGTAAQGDLAEYQANKGVANGYASLTAGKIPFAQIPSSVGTGTVTSVALTMPAQFSVSGSPITTNGTFGVSWVNQSDQTWFGNKSGAPAVPQFYTTALPVGLIPSLDAAKVTSGTFAAARLPIAVGIGGSHAIGAVPDPGDGSGGAAATDYLARDMTFKAAPSLGPSYQPVISDPVIGESTNGTGSRTITVKAGTGGETGLTFFYSLTSDSADFVEFPAFGGVSLPGGDEIWVYAAAAGYTNSNVVNYTNPNAP